MKRAHGPEKEAAMRAAQNRECEIVLTTYDTFRSMLADVQRVEWEVTIWDEAHKMKNDKSAIGKAGMQVPCKRRFGLTGASCMVVCRPAARAFRRTASVRAHDSSVLVRRGSIWLGLGLG